MSRLDELIKELCPNGVEYKELGEIFNLKNGYTPSKSNSEYWENADVNWFRIEDINTNGGILKNSIQRVNIKGIKGNLFAAKSLIVSTTATIGKHALILKEFICNQQFTCLTIKENYEKIYNSKFMYYYFFKISELVKKNLKVSSFPSVDMDKFKKFLIPLPPLKVQEEIVKILDDYTKSVEELKEKLNAELITRKKQYSWYRDYLLKFENKVEMVTLGDISEYSKDKIDIKELNSENYIGIENMLQDAKGVIKSSCLLTEGRCTKFFEGDILIGNIRPYLKKIWLSDRIGGANTDVLVIKKSIESIDNKYLFFVLSSEKFFSYVMRSVKAGKMPRGNKEMIMKYQFPLPPLEVQKRIVEVLDNFEKTCKKLNIELSSEIEIKQKEYEFVRNYLLTFEEKSRQAILACELASLRSKQQAQNLIKILQYVYGYVEVRLGDIGSIVRGNGLQKRDFTEEGVGCIHYGQIYTKYGMVAEKTISFVEESLAEKLRKVEKGDIIFTVTSENIEDLCKCVVWLGEEEIVTGGHTAILKHNQNSKFLAYYFQTEAFHNQKRKLATGTKVIDVTATKLEEILIPLPSLEEQQRIVDILDRFDKLCNDISEGLPAEIEARQKQYEYFREKLLSFKKI